MTHPVRRLLEGRLVSTDSHQGVIAEPTPIPSVEGLHDVDSFPASEGVKVRLAPADADQGEIAEPAPVLSTWVVYLRLI